jgi:hypothetical protein
MSKEELLEKAANMVVFAQSALEEVKAFANKGNQAAGRRARHDIQTLKEIAQEVRVEIQAQKNARG